MKDLIKFGCKECGSPHLIEKDGKLRCITCGAVFEKSIETDEERDARILYLSRLDRAEELLGLSPPRFDEAEDHFRDFIKHYPKNSDGYWGLVRARYGIRYEKDMSGKMIPSCYKSSYEDFREDSDFVKALSLAENDTIRNEMKAQSKLIADVCKEWREKTKKYQYDVFISFKAPDEERGISDEDQNVLSELYDDLRDEGYKVFFSPKTMKNHHGEHYDAYIFNALQSAKVMIVYGSKPEYFTATWVQNEWTRYLRMVSNKEKSSDSCLVAYKNFNANELPHGLKELQAMDAGKNNFYHLLVGKINDILKRSKENEDSAPEASQKRKQDDRDLESKREELRRLKEKNELDKQIEDQQRLALKNEERAQKEKEIADRKRHQAEQKQKLINNSKNAKYKLQNTFDNIKNTLRSFIVKNKKAVIISSVSLLVAISLILLINGLAKNNNNDNDNDGKGDGYYEEEDDGSCVHVFGDWIIVKDATEDAAGEKMRVCTECGFEDKEAIPKNDHVHDVQIRPAVEATCTTVGKTEGSYCAKCEMTLVSQESIPMNHAFVNGECKYCHTTDAPSIGLAITDYGDEYSIAGIGDCPDEKVVIPMVRNGKPVTSIDYEAFKNNDNITEVVIPVSIKSIPQNAFEGCDNLRKVTINGSLERIENRAFWQCASLEEVIINGSVESIGGGAFYGCTSLKEINIPKGINSIDGSVKYDYDDYGAFEGCTGLTKVTIGDESSDIKITIGDRAFFECYELEDVILGNGVTYIGSFAFMYSGVKNLTLGSGLINIAGGAFYGCDNLIEIVIPETVKSISDRDYISTGYATGNYYGAFGECDSLKKVTINGSLERIGTMAFWKCASLEEVIINGSVESIGGGAFYGCTSLKEINLPKGINSIDGSVEYNYDDYGVFEGCTGLTKVTVGDESSDIKITIGDRAFYECYKLEEVTLGNGVTEIGAFAFMYTGVKTVTLGDNLEAIAGGAFYGCSELLEITIPKKVEAISDRDYISTGYATGDYYGAFGKCESLKKVTFNSDNITIGTMAFWQCISLEEVIFNGVVESIGGGAFYGCTSLKEISIPEGIKSIDGYIEYDHDDYGVFEGCIDLAKVTIGGDGSDVEFTIGNRAFFGCSALSDVTIGKGVTEIWTEAFGSCTSLGYVSYLGTEAEWGDVYKNNGWCQDTNILEVYFNG